MFSKGFSHADPCNIVKKISGTKIRSKKAKVDVEEPCVSPSSMSHITSHEKGRYSSHVNRQRRMKNSVANYECDCGTTFTLRKNMMAHQRHGCRIYSIFEDLRHLQDDLSQGKADLKQTPQLINDLLTKHKEVNQT